jgi:threonine/homoserine/homoserine lactone efflux protein
LLSGTNALILFLIATVSLNLSPGPDMLYVISRSLGQGRKAGIVSALGIGAGTLVHTSIAALGLAAILVSLPIAFQTSNLLVQLTSFSWVCACCSARE